MELICSSGRGRGEGLGAAEGRAGPLLWEDDERGSGHLVPADGWDGQGGEGARLGWPQKEGSDPSRALGPYRDMPCLRVEGPEL